MAKRNPVKLGTVWTAGAKIQRINHDSMKWETLAQCNDTPNAIAAAVTKLVEAGHKKSTLWVSGQASGRKMVTA